MTDIDGRRCETGACLIPDEYFDEEIGRTYIRIRSTVTGTAVQCTPAEWQAFLIDLADGRWAHIGQEAVASC